MNIVFVVFDTLRYDHLGTNGNPWIRTPHLDRFAAEATVFDNHYAASYATIPHRLDVITGRDGDPFQAWHFASGTKPPVPDDYRFHDPYLDGYHAYWQDILPDEVDL